MNRTPYILGGIVLLFILMGGVLLLRSGSDSARTNFSALTNRELATLCDADMNESFHIHPILEISVDGERVTVPSNIGVTPACMTALHTHTDDGVIHVESPEKRDFTLGDFFAVWGKSFSKDQILDSKADGERIIKVTVNGEPVDTYENTVLKDGDTIRIAYEARSPSPERTSIEGAVGP